MKQGVTYLLILIGGIGIGYAINAFLTKPQEIQTKTETVVVEKVKKEIVRDTVEVEKIVHYPLPSDSIQRAEKVVQVDSINHNIYNSIDHIEDDTEEIIIKEVLISMKTYTLEEVPLDSTDVSALLELKSNAFAKDIIVEFWQSPLNLTGYELTRNKLKLFGFNPNESISLRIGNQEDQIILNTDSMSLLLQKTKQFKSLKLR